MFAQIATKTVYSFMDSLIDLPSYIQRAKALGYQAVGIMDKDNLYAAYHFIIAAQKAGLQPILALETSFLYQEQPLTVYLIAKNSQGYHHLLKLSTAVMSEQRDLLALTEYLEQLVFIVPYFEGITDLNLPFAYYIGVDSETPPSFQSERAFPIHCVRYFDNADTETLQVLHAIRDNLPLREVPAPAKNQYLLPKDTLETFFQKNFPDSLKNMEKELAHVSYDFNQVLKLPRFNRERPAVTELQELVEAGLRSKGLTSSDYQERVAKELSIIHAMGFDDYFLIVWDLLRFGRSKGYYMGMGRGSAAGSLVAFALDITGIDPVANNLLFERFLNQERYSMPDIDIDLPDIYRNQFLNYVRDRYGSKHSAQIVTFSTFGAKQAIRDVFKRFGATEYELSQLTRKIGFKDTLSRVHEKNITFRQLINSKAEYQKAFEMAKKIEGHPRQTSIHAAGIVMSDDDLTNHIPLKSGDEMMVTQYDAEAVEANGLLKMDFLGLRNLTFLQKMQENLIRQSGQEIAIEAIDLEDEKTLALFAAGNTKGIFQFEAAGAINLLRRIKPSRFEEVVATTSLNRPGASDYTENFIRRKYGQEAPDMLDPLLSPILASTYGIMLYQEQVMQIAQVYAGFTLGKADLLRRAMSKKQASSMQKMEAEFLAGAAQLGHEQTKAKAIFARMAKFAGYGFNRSHAYAYSALAFQMAYFKAHYPDVFYNVLLNYSNSDYIADALGNGFKVAKTTINDIPYRDKVSGNKIFLGLKNIKGFSQDFAYWLIEHRPFTSVEDFLMQVPEKYRKPDQLEPLIKIGLFDHFESNRHKIVANLDNLLIFISELGSLFADSAYSWTTSEDYSTAEKYQMERDILGAGISPHPLLEIAKTSTFPIVPINDLVKDNEALILAQVETVKLIRTKSKGEQMAFLRVTDTQKRLDITLFPEVYQRYRLHLVDHQMAYFKGKIQERDNRLQMILQEMTPVTSEKFWIQLANHDYDREVSHILAAYPGNIPVILHYQESRETLQSSQYFVANSPEMQADLLDYTMKTVFR